jgi:L-asparaginase
MEDIFIINTGGTFNKIYNKISGNLDIDTTQSTLKSIATKWQAKLKYSSIINKDSLEFTNSDREELLDAIKNSNYNKIVVVHGTDTIDISADYVAENIKDKTIVFTGAMVPFWIDKVEATANLAMALGFCKLAQNGVYIALNGVVGEYKEIKKDKEQGLFKRVLP